jgi:DNA polymerase
MEAKRRSRLLKALEIETWTVRGPASVGGEELLAAPAQEAATLKPERLPPPIVRPAPRDLVMAPAARVELAEAATPYVAPSDWPALAEAVSGCQRCKLCRTRTKTVFGVGPKAAPLLIVGEGPGADEDAQGEPFVGRAGKLLDEMLKAIGRSRTDNTYIANVVKCRPPGNRDPEADEVAACRPYLDRQIELIQPKLIVALGRIAAQRLLSSDAPLSKLRGPVHEYGPTRTPVMITYHPAYLLRSPGEKAKSWSDLKQVHQFLAQA